MPESTQAQKFDLNMKLRRQKKTSVDKFQFTTINQFIDFPIVSNFISCKFIRLCEAKTNSREKTPKKENSSLEMRKKGEELANGKLMKRWRI